MKTIITTFLLLMMTTLTFGQQKTLELVEDNKYLYTVYNEDGSIHQKGTFIKLDDNKLIKHSYWRDDVGTKALYDNGKLVWIKPKGQPKYTYQELEFEKMKAELERLKQLVALKN